MHRESGSEPLDLSQAIESLDEASRALADALAQTLSGQGVDEAAADGTEPSLLMVAWSEREAAFERVVAAAAAGHRPGAADRVRLEEIRSRDEAWMARGGEAAQGLSSARLDLGRRRNAATAHQLRERETPRFIAVKA